MNERVTHLADLRFRLHSTFPRRLDRRCVPHPTRPPEPATIRGRCARARRMPAKPGGGHARLQVTKPRRRGAPMLRNRVTELHYITPVANLSSIVTHGVLSPNRATRLSPTPTSVADEHIQGHRLGKRVPQGLPLILSSCLAPADWTGSARSESTLIRGKIRTN
jgi:hypothetical protein